MEGTNKKLSNLSFHLICPEHNILFSNWYNILSLINSLEKESPRGVAAFGKLFKVNF